MRITLEDEFKARVYLHQISILGGYIMDKYLREEQAKEGAKLSPHILMQQADEYSNKVMQKAFKTGEFNSMYEEAWQAIADKIPEHMIIPMPY